MTVAPRALLNRSARVPKTARDPLLIKAFLPEAALAQDESSTQVFAAQMAQTVLPLK